MKPKCPTCSKSSNVFTTGAKITKKKLKELEVVIREKK
jgi:hypothetical protein